MASTRSPDPSARIAAAATLLAASFPVFAGPWQFKSSLSLGERYSDNVTLSDDALAQSDWITEISPSFSVSRKGPRAEMQATYALQARAFAQGVLDNDIGHNLNGQLKSELVRDWFYFDATARVSEEMQDLSQSTGLGDVVGSQNANTVQSYSLTPYLKHRFGAYGTAEARYSTSLVTGESSALSDSNVNTWQIKAVSGTHFYPLSWNLDYTNTRNDRTDSGVGSTNGETLNAVGHYNLTSRWGLVGQYGLEKHDYSSVAANLSDYAYYGLGFSYTPGRRFKAELLYNDSDQGGFVSGLVSVSPSLRTELSLASSRKAYGRSHSLKLVHKARRSTWNLTYTDSLTTQQEQYLSITRAPIFDVYDCSGVRVYVPIGAASPNPQLCQWIGYANDHTGTLSQTNAAYISKNLSGSMSYTRKRHTFGLSLFSNQREYQDIGSGDETSTGYQASWAYTASPRTTLSLSTGQTLTEASAGGREDETANVALVLTRRLQTKLTASLETRHQQRASNQSGDDYSENSVAARVNMSF